jgi:hypothetical protein
MAYVYREWLRRKVAGLVSWRQPQELKPGCTALIGMCSGLPDVLRANLMCLNDHSWPDLTEVIVVVDNREGRLPPEIEEEAASVCTRLRLRVLYYSESQYRTAERIRLPYLFSWLSWCIGLSECMTQHILFHDYDALIMSNALEQRYRAFVESGVKIQGIRHYNGNGVIPEDRLATTFEAFADHAWLRSFPPVRLFNKLRSRDGRFIDYDTTLDIQHNDIAESERSTVPMSQEDLVHPSQMIHQYTMFRRNPGKPLPCFSIPMIPFFEYLSGGELALMRALQQIRGRTSRRFQFLGSKLLVNFDTLQVASVDWCLKQMLQACIAREIEPFRALYDYGLELYRLADCPDDLIWARNFTDPQRRWIDRSRSLL